MRNLIVIPSCLQTCIPGNFLFIKKYWCLTDVDKSTTSTLEGLCRNKQGKPHVNNGIRANTGIKGLFKKKEILDFVSLSEEVVYPVDSVFWKAAGQEVLVQMDHRLTNRAWEACSWMNRACRSFVLAPAEFLYAFLHRRLWISLFSTGVALGKLLQRGQEEQLQEQTTLSMCIPAW